MADPKTQMQSTLAGGSPAPVRRSWEAPAMTMLPIRTGTKAANASETPDGRAAPAAPAAPASKLGFAFEMSFPLAARTE